jgi:ribosomal protein L16 Arg81 hydroxylase
VSTATMAKKKPAKAATPAPERRRTVLTIKGTEEWREWLEALSRQLREPVSTAVDKAIVMYAKANNFDREAPER